MVDKDKHPMENAKPKKPKAKPTSILKHRTSTEARFVNGEASLSKKQRILFREFYNANKAHFEDDKIKNIVPIWYDGYTCGKYSQNWSR